MNINILEGKILSNIDNNNDEELLFTTSTGEKYIMYHEQDCCEYVRIEDINGNLEDLLNNPILQAEESTNSDDTCTKWPCEFKLMFGPDSPGARSS